LLILTDVLCILSDMLFILTDLLVHSDGSFGAF
jgi:hypothetical protein